MKNKFRFFKIGDFILHVQQTPYPAAQDPELVPPLVSHSSAV